MRPFLTFAWAAAPAAVIATLYACGSSGTSSGTPDDAGPDADATSLTDGLPNIDVITGSMDSSSDLCQLDDGSDPVLLCTQYQALQYIVQFAYQAGTGAAIGFSSQAPYDAITGHQWQDDFRLASALSEYTCSANYYHNTNLFTSTLEGLAPIVTGELPEAMASYDGEPYFQLRSAAIGYFASQDMSNGAAFNAAAETLARNIASQFVFTVPFTSHTGGDGGAGEGGAEAGSEAGDAGSSTSYIIGTHNTDGTVTYLPQQSVMAAAALLDMASRYLGNADAGMEAEAATWQAIGTQALAYMWARGRDPVTGLFYQTLTTSPDPAHDVLGAGSYTPDNLLTDVQGLVVLGLARAHAATAPLVLGDAGLAIDGAVILPPPYATQAESLALALTCLGKSLSPGCVGLFDGTFLDPLSPPQTVAPAAFMEGYVPSTGLVLTNKTTLGNSLMFGGTARASALGAGALCVGVNQCLNYENAGIREAVSATNAVGVPWPPNSNLMSVVLNPMNQVVQLSFLRAASKGFSWATGYVLDAGPEAGPSTTQATGAMNYTTAATSAMIEGLTQLWYGRQNPPTCGL